LIVQPYRFPVLRSGFHYHFLHLLLDKPFRQHLQLLRVASVPPSLELVFVFDFDVSHNHGQLLFMYIDSRYPIRHKLLLAGAESVPKITLSRVSGYRRSQPGRDNAHLFALSRTLRIRQAFGLSFSTDYSISPLPTIENYRSNSERFS